MNNNQKKHYRVSYQFTAFADLPDDIIASSHDDAQKQAEVIAQKCIDFNSISTLDNIQYTYDAIQIEECEDE